MSFKDEYKEAFDSVVPDKAFLDKLSEKMENEKNRKRGWKKQGIIAAACILLLVLIGLAVRYAANISPDGAEPVRINTGNSLRTPTEEPNLFETPKWYDEADGAEKIYLDFVTRLSDDGELELLYRNTENNFTDDMVLTQAAAHELAEQLGEAEVVTEPVEKMGSCLCYMAQFKNGDIIKFNLYENGYFVFQDYEAVYQLK